jgi:sugar phosphate permease
MNLFHISILPSAQTLASLVLQRPHEATGLPVSARHSGRLGMPDGSNTPRVGVYRGWFIVAAGVVAALTTLGSTVYVFGLLVLPLTKEFSLSRSEVNLGFMTLLTGAALWGPVAGRLVDRVSIRVMMPIGGALLAAGAIWIALTHSLVAMLLAAFLLVAPGFCMGGSLAANAVVSRWFKRRRGRVMGLMAVATSAGGFFITPAAAYLIDNYGWRQALMALGIAVGIVVALAGLLVMRDRPSEEEWQRSGEPGDESLAGAAPHDAVEAERTWSMAEMLRNRSFWLILVAAALLKASDQALLALQVPFYQSRGVSLQAASVLIAVQSGSAVCGKILVGFLAERFDVRRLFAIVAWMHVVTLALFIAWPGYWIMLTFLAVAGVAIGGVLPLWLTISATAFGSRSFGQVTGTMTMGTQFLSIVFIGISGASYDRTGGYTLAFGVFMAGAVLAGLLIQMLRLPKAPVDADSGAVQGTLTGSEQMG